MGGRHANRALVVVCVASLVLPAAVAAFTKVGPVVVTFTPSHGVHVFDLVACLPAVALGSLLAFRALR